MKILAISDVRGDLKYMDRLGELVRDRNPDIVIFAGNTLPGEERFKEWLNARREGREPEYTEADLRKDEEEAVKIYESFFDTLGKLNVLTAVIPGVMDSPGRLYYPTVMHHESIFPTVHSIHGGFILSPERSYVIAGYGGLLTENEEEDRMVLAFPRWRAEYDLKFLHQLEQDRVLIFNTIPGDGDGLDLEKGSEVVTTLIKMHHPKVVFCGGLPHVQKQEYVGDSLIVLPGGFNMGKYAFVDTRARDVIFGTIG